MTQPSSAAPAKPATRITGTSPATTDSISTDDGKISVAQGVVQKIAGIACREVSGVHAMGASTSRAFGAVRERIPGSSGPNVAQGVGVEVGETQAAIDLDAGTVVPGAVHRVRHGPRENVALFPRGSALGWGQSNLPTPPSWPPRLSLSTPRLDSRSAC